MFYKTAVIRGGSVEQQRLAELAQMQRDLEASRKRLAQLNARAAAAHWHPLKTQQQDRPRTTCGNCGSSLITRDGNTVSCGLCHWSGAAYITKDTPIQERHPGAQWCSHCRSGNVLFGAKTLYCRNCGKETWRWP